MDNALERTSEESRAIVSQLGEMARSLGRQREDTIRQEVGPVWIALRSTKRDRVFAEIRPHRTRVEVFILPRPQDLMDPAGLARRAPPTQGWGWFRTRFHVSSTAEVSFAFRLIRQSYEYQRRRPNGRAPRRRIVRSRQTV